MAEPSTIRIDLLWLLLLQRRWIPVDGKVQMRIPTSFEEVMEVRLLLVLAKSLIYELSSLLETVEIILPIRRKILGHLWLQ